jgi:membrane-bound serine protease (ClpP class)
MTSREGLVKGFAGLFLVYYAAIGAAPAGAAVLSLQVNDVIQPIVAEYVVAGIAQAEREHALAVIIRLNTPGGLDQSMREIIEKILTSKVPVISFVGPSGARAASAGFFILLSSDLAVMAPGTNSGAAHPVSITGGRLDDIMAKKIENDAAAYIRSIVAKRGRNAQMAERGVLESKSFTESEALATNLIDGVAKDEQEICSKFDGKEISRFAGEKIILKLKGEPLREVPMSLRQKVLTEVLNPNIALLLGLVGLVGLYIEFTSPGAILPGIVGGICLFLALVAFNLLPVNSLGVILLLTAIVLFVIEAKVASYGVLAALGLASMILGSLILIDSPLPELRVHLSTALGVALPFAAITIFLLRLVLLSHRTKSVTGGEGMMGEVGFVLSELQLEGRVQIHGEIWRARSLQPISVGEKVKVTAVEGLMLVVARV